MTKVESVRSNSDYLHGKGVKPAKYNINWFHTILLTATPALALYGWMTTQVYWQTVVLAVALYFLTGMGITAGYHRMWSHRAFKAVFPIRLILALFGAAAFEGSIFWWSRNHRAHHRHNDTDKDPYNVRKGFWWAHIGWMLVKQDYRKAGSADVSDLRADPLVMWQHKHYVEIALLTGIVFPTLLAGMLWGDYRGGYFYAVMARMVFVHHATFFVNSLAHTLGDRPFSHLQSAMDSWVTAVLTLGEGYHNFHHSFNFDYRNGVQWYHYDPTKWLIRMLSFVGLTYDLQSAPTEEIIKSRLQVDSHKLERQQRSLAHGSQFDILPATTWADVKRRVAEGENLLVIQGFVIDVSLFVDDHPGGRLMLLRWVGKDVTGLFHGGHLDEPNEWPHFHTTVARNMLPAMRVARLVA